MKLAISLRKCNLYLFRPKWRHKMS